MSVNSRAKGQRAERQAIAVLQPIVDKVYREMGIEPPALERNLMQSMKGGHDVVGLDWMALEIKHQETLHIEDWWSQAVWQAGDDKIPILMYKQNRALWSVRLLVRLKTPHNNVVCPGIITLDAFLVWFELHLRQQLTPCGQGA